MNKKVMITILLIIMTGVAGFLACTSFGRVQSRLENKAENQQTMIRISPSPEP
jgi:positive regulator of sigma E activity